MYDEGYDIAKRYTFGAPRYGNKQFSTFIDMREPDTYRVTHHKDPVPHLPPTWFGYWHSMSEA